MLITVPSPLLKSERLTLHPILDYSVSLIEYHVVHHFRVELESGTFLMGHLFQYKTVL